MPANVAPEMRRYYQQLTRFSAALAFLADVSMGTLGGALKRKEKLSARLGDILRQQGRRDDARASYNRALALDANLQIAKDGLKALGSAN